MEMGDGGPVAPETRVWPLPTHPRGWQRHSVGDCPQGPPCLQVSCPHLLAPTEWPWASGCLFPSLQPRPCSSALSVVGRRARGPSRSVSAGCFGE